jgi:hypothetical protein
VAAAAAVAAAAVVEPTATTATLLEELLLEALLLALVGLPLLALLPTVSLDGTAVSVARGSPTKGAGAGLVIT